MLGLEGRRGGSLRLLETVFFISFAGYFLPGGLISMLAMCNMKVICSYKPAQLPPQTNNQNNHYK